MSDSNGNINQTSQRKISRINQHSIHALIAAYFNLMSKLNGITTFSHHVDEVSKNRIRSICFFPYEKSNYSFGTLLKAFFKPQIKFPVISGVHLFNKKD
jgi:hypothetical protein